MGGDIPKSKMPVHWGSPDHGRFPMPSGKDIHEGSPHKARVLRAGAA